MKNYQFQIILLLLICSFSKVFTQKNEDNDSKFSIWFGVRNFSQPPISSSDKLDFFDFYLSHDWENTNYKANYEYLGFSYSKKWNKQFETDLRMSVNSVFTPNTLYARGIYYQSRYIGFALSYYTYPQLLNNYEEFFQHSLNYRNMNSQILEYDHYPQWKVYDHTVSVGLISPLSFGSVHLKLGFHAGFMFLSPLSTDIFLSSTNTNYRALQNYRFTPSSAFFVNPEASLEFDIHEYKNKIFGFQFQTSWLWTKRSINYKLTQNEWTMETTSSQNINAVKHKFEKLEFDGGLFLKW